MTRAALAEALGGHLPPPGARVGLLGGSFNPAHEGHLEISSIALQRLGLDELWWLVSPQNPLKPEGGMAPLAERLAGARALTRGRRRIIATDLERLLGTRYTADSLVALVRRFPRVRFVWIMGADNLIQISSWQRWPQILNSVAIAVFDRPSYSLRASAAKAAQRYARYRVPERSAKRLAAMTPPAWTFLHQQLNFHSATAIRAGQQHP